MEFKEIEPFMTEEQLFRRKATDARRHNWLGTILASTPLSRWRWTALALSLALTTLLLIFLGHHAQQ